MGQYNLVGISGSLRQDSFNSQLIGNAHKAFDPETFTFADIEFPLYSGDVEAAGMPDAVTRLQAQIADADAVVISTPEYNQALSGVLKNALDWISRGGPKPLEGKPVAIMSAAAGRSGGARATYSLRLALASFSPRLLSGEVLVAQAFDEFDAGGGLKSERYLEQLQTLMVALKEEVRRDKAA